MAYVTTAQLLARYSRGEMIALTDIAEEGEVNTTVLQNAIDRGASWIDSHAKKRRTVPMDPAPDEAEHFNQFLTLYYLHADRHSVTEDLRKEKEALDDWLRAYVDGEVAFSDDDDPDSVAASGKQTANDRVWTRDDMEGW